MSQTILVVGGTGNYGQFVCRQLAKDGFDVRVFTRKREKALRLLGEKFQIFEGNFEDDDSLRRALAGCDGVHLNLRGWWKDKSHYRNEHQGAVNVVRLAKEAGVQRLTSISDIHAREEYSFLPHLGAKVETEKMIRASGIPFAIFACSFFMENLHHLEKGDRIRVPFLDSSYHYLAAEDYARIVSRAYQAPAMPNQRIDLYGPELIHAHEMAQRFCSIVRPQTKILTVPVWLMGIYMRLTGHLNRQYSVRVLRFYRKTGEVGDPSRADHSLGQPSIRFREWCEAQRPATAG